MAIHILDQGELLYAVAHADDDVRTAVARANRDHRRGWAKMWAIEAAGRTVYATCKPEAKSRLREIAAAIQSGRTHRGEG